MRLSPRCCRRQPNSESRRNVRSPTKGPRPRPAREAVATATARGSPAHRLHSPTWHLLRGPARRAPAPSCPRVWRGLAHLHFCLRGPLGVDQQIIENRLLLALRSAGNPGQRGLGGRHVRPGPEPLRQPAKDKRPRPGPPLTRGERGGVT